MCRLVQEIYTNGQFIPATTSFSAMKDAILLSNETRPSGIGLHVAHGGWRGWIVTIADGGGCSGLLLK